MKSFFFLLLVSLSQFGILAAANNLEQATPAKVDYLLEISRVKELGPKIKDYLVLLEIKSQKKLISKKKELNQIYEAAYPQKIVEKLLVDKVQKKFSKSEINKLVAIFESNEMKKFLASQNDILKEILNEQQNTKSKELSLKVEQLLK